MKGCKWGPIGGISILDCMVPTTCGQGQERIKGVKGAKGREGEGRGVKGASMEQREQTGSEGSEGELRHFYTRF